jgi:signal transduction histidine kinase
MKRFTSHRSRILLTLLIGLTLTQTLSYIIWRDQENQKHYSLVNQVTKNLAYRILSTIEFFEELPTSYRHVVLNQLRQMGGARFYVSINNDYLKQEELPPRKDKQIAKDNFIEILGQAYDPKNIHINFTTAETLTVHKDSTKLSDLPTRWSGRLVLAPLDSPITVIQIRFDDGQWLYVATMLPISDFMNISFVDRHDIIYLLFILTGVAIIGAIMVHYQTKPLLAIQVAAQNLSQDIYHAPLPEKGSSELKDVASMFNQLQSKIQGYLQERETIFSAMSHDLKTPITRLRLRAEMLNETKHQERLIRDIDLIDDMVKDALSVLKNEQMSTPDSRIELGEVLEAIKREVNSNLWPIVIRSSSVCIISQHSSIKRALTNFIDNAIKYGQGCEISITDHNDTAVIKIRDFGPGIPPSQQEIVFSPFVRLEHSRNRNEGGTGLGMGLARSMVRKLGGEVVLENHAKQGLVVNVFIPKSRE